jgi:hypothetical protein
MADEIKENESSLPAKTISKLFKFLSAFGIIVCSVFKWIGILPGATIGEICIVWSVVYGLGAGTIDLNIMFDKFIGGRE